MFTCMCLHEVHFYISRVYLHIRDGLFDFLGEGGGPGFLCPPNFEKVGSILVLAFPYVCLYGAWRYCLETFIYGFFMEK